MTGRLLVLFAAFTAGCAGTPQSQNNEINARLDRLEARLDALVGRAVASEPSGLSVDNSAQRAALVGQINVLKAQGFTDEYAPVRQLKAEMAGLDEPAARSDERASIVAQIRTLKAQGFTDNYPPLQQLAEELAVFDAKAR